jgi:hypothetical protein
MLIHPMAERLRDLGPAAMADAFLDLRSQSAADDLSREDWLGLLIDRKVTARDNKRLWPKMECCPAATECRGRGCRSAHATWARPRPVPLARDLRLDPQEPALTDRRADRRGQVLVGLRARAQGVP